MNRIIEEKNKIERANFKVYNDAIEATLPLRDVWYASLQDLRRAVEEENLKGIEAQIEEKVLHSQMVREMYDSEKQY